MDGMGSLYLHLVDFYGKFKGQYAILMDPMGIGTFCHDFSLNAFAL